ncbi:MAG: ribosome-associated translation inhibitor RaiA [Candidatus Moraniibacteriota bacterium]|nr:MAG: ribosome-associated translation inhibitor RaiA [Candidatus Moranbacteria bacterium]
MKTRFLFQGVELDGKQMAYVSKRLLRIKKLLTPADSIEVEVDRNKKNQFRVEVMVVLPRKLLFRSEEMTESVEGSIDAAIDDIERQIVEHKEKRNDLLRRGGRSIKKRLTIAGEARL